VKLHSGFTQGRLTVLGEVDKDERGRRRLEVVCDCGEKRILIRKSFLMNKPQSCGCLRTERLKEAVTTHGHLKDENTTPEYFAWRSMLARCYDEKSDSFSYYGGRGIGVCKAWKDSFESFFKNVGSRPSDDHVLCLIDKDKNFSPKNTEWRTRFDADRTKRSNTFYTVNGVTKCFVDWAAEYGILKSTLHYRVVTKGMSMRDALDVGRGRQGKILPGT
jgi:hypothetical protein